jgi:hypothetical protein
MPKQTAPRKIRKPVRPE